MKTRRETLHRAAGLGAAVLLPSLLRPGRARGQATEEDPREFLEQTIELEQASVLAYETAVEGPDVEAGLRGTLELLRDQEQAHANAWRSALDLLGFEAPDPPSQAGDSAELEGLAGLERSEELLTFLAEHERRLIRRYLELAPELASEDLARTSAEVVASHAQHLVVLRSALGEDPPEALARVGT